MLLGSLLQTYKHPDKVSWRPGGLADLDFQRACNSNQIGCNSSKHIAGDIRRAIAACERLVILNGDAASSHERRDLAVLLLHGGLFARAKAELGAYQSSAAAATADPIDQVKLKISAMVLL